MSIFVDKNILFNIELNGKFIKDNFGNHISFKECDSEEVKILARCKGRDFETMSGIIEDSSIINAVTGKPLLRSGLFCQLVVLNFIKEIKIITESNEVSYVINKDFINKTQYDIIKSLATKWLAITDGRT